MKRNEVWDLTSTGSDDSHEEAFAADDSVVVMPTSSITSSEPVFFNDPSSADINSDWQPFYLNSIPTISSELNERALTIEDLLSTYGGKDVTIEHVAIFSYMLEAEWLLECCPILLAVPVLLLHGGTQKLPHVPFDNITMSLVDMGPERFGTHHNKILLVFYKSGVRVVITTANFIETDFTTKVQGIFVQDFPSKTATIRSHKDLERDIYSSKGGSDRSINSREGINSSCTNKAHASQSSLPSPLSCQFENDLVAHLQRITPYERKAKSELDKTIRRLRDYDYSAAEVGLISSVPGRFAGDSK
jgi:hypothetical protein